MNIYINYYRDSNPERQAELEKSLAANLANPDITRVFALTEVEMEPHPKLTVIPFRGRPTYLDFARIINTHTPDISQINCIQNTDCWWSDCTRVKEMTTRDAFCVSRWTDGKLGDSHGGRFSQDAWIIRGKWPEEMVMEFHLGKPGCDNAIAYIFDSLGFRISNPCHDLKLVHEHATNVRHYTQAEMVRRPYLPVKPCRMYEPMPSHIDWGCEWHLGDHLWHAHIMRRIAEKYPNLTQRYYCPARYHDQVRPVLGERMELSPWVEECRNKTVNAHIGRTDVRCDLTEYWSAYVHLCRAMSNDANIDIPICTPEDMIHDHPAIINADIRGLRADVLVINSTPQSSQWTGPNKMARVVRQFKERGFTVATTAPAERADFCTLNQSLDVVQIAKLSTTCRYIVAIHTGPLILCLNQWTLDHAERIWVCDATRHGFKHPKITNITRSIDLKGII